jgi:hypothetical protein
MKGKTMNYIIRDSEREKEFVECSLWKRDNGDIALHVGQWVILNLCTDGTVRLTAGIRPHNAEGLQVDDNGKVVLRHSPKLCATGLK